MRKKMGRTQVIRNLAFLLALSMATAVLPQQPTAQRASENAIQPVRDALAITASPEVPLGRWVLINVHEPEGTSAIKLRVLRIMPGQDADVTYDEGPNLLRVEGDGWVFAYPAEGKYIVEAYAAVNDEIVTASAPFVIGTTPPEPGPEPTPPDPDPQPDAAPFPSPDGLRVLIIEESAARGELPDGQRDIITSPEIEEFLDSVTVQDGEYVGWRKWDDDFTDDQLRYVSDKWRKAYAAAKRDSKGKLPWLVAANGNKGYSGPLPKTPEEFRKLLEGLK